MSTPGSNTFGNYMLHDLLDSGLTFHEIQLPDAISWWPSTPGWTVLGSLAALWLARKLYLNGRRFWQNRYRREALRHLHDLDRVEVHASATALSQLLRAVALHAYPRRDVAALSGADWLAFLDSTAQQPGFDSQLGQLWLQAQYQHPERCQLGQTRLEQLIVLSEQWILTHPAHCAPVNTVKSGASL